MAGHAIAFDAWRRDHERDDCVTDRHRAAMSDDPAGSRETTRGVSMMNDLYDDDIVLWSERQAALLRRRAAGELINEADLDWPNIAEEIESLGKRDARELASRITTILIHLIRLRVSAAAEPRAGWRNIVLTQQREPGLLLKDAPSLRGKVAAVIAAELDTAKQGAIAELAVHGEQILIDLAPITFTPEQVLTFA